MGGALLIFSKNTQIDHYAGGEHLTNHVGPTKLSRSRTAADLDVRPTQ